MQCKPTHFELEALINHINIMDSSLLLDKSEKQAPYCTLHVFRINYDRALFVVALREVGVDKV